jgi:hypothetical protein
MRVPGIRKASYPYPLKGILRNAMIANLEIEARPLQRARLPNQTYQFPFGHHVPNFFKQSG